MKTAILEQGSQMWWDIVLSMPHLESIEMLKSYRAMLVEQNAGKSTALAAGTLLIRVNDNIKRINSLIENSRWQKACANVLTPELYETVYVEKRRLEGSW